MTRQIRNSCALLTLSAILAGCATYPEFVHKFHQPADLGLNLDQALRVSSIGFDPEDSTSFLQIAFNSPAPLVIIDAMPSPWRSRPLTLPSGKTIVFEPGAVLEAKRGEFRDPGDKLLSGENLRDLHIVGYGATVKMWKSDYQSANYAPSEYRMAFALYDVDRVSISGLRILSSGGDGIYLGATNESTGRRNSNVLLRDLVVSDNHRQGLSVVSAKGLLIENCLFENTGGTAPAAGIDFEPNRPNEVLQNIVVRNCLVRWNQGTGIAVQVHQYQNHSPPVDIRIENTVAYGNTSNFHILEFGQNGGGVVEFVNSKFPHPNLIIRAKFRLPGLKGE